MLKVHQNSLFQSNPPKFNLFKVKRQNLYYLGLVPSRVFKMFFDWKLKFLLINKKLIVLFFIIFFLLLNPSFHPYHQWKKPFFSWWVWVLLTLPCQGPWLKITSPMENSHKIIVPLTSVSLISQNKLMDGSQTPKLKSGMDIFTTPT